LRLLLLADLGGDRSVPLASTPAAEDRHRRLRPRAGAHRAAAGAQLDGQALAWSFAALDDFHPDHLFDRLPVFEALRRLREQALDPTQFRRVAPLRWAWRRPRRRCRPSPPAVATPTSPPTSTRLLGRAPQRADGAAARPPPAR
jgi:hypothetical protein